MTSELPELKRGDVGAGACASLTPTKVNWSKTAEERRSFHEE